MVSLDRFDIFRAVVEATGDMEALAAGARQAGSLDLLGLNALRALGRGAEADALWSELSADFESLEASLQANLEGRLISRAMNLVLGGR